MTEKLISERLDCVLSDKEKSTSASLAARAHNEIQRIEADKKTANAGFTSQIKSQTEILHKNSEAVRTGIETRYVQVRVTYDLENRTVRYRRLDTEDVYESRKMTDDEYRVLKAEQDVLSLDLDVDDDPQAVPVQENDWLPLSVSRPAPDELVETALYNAEEETYERYGRGFIYPEKNAAYNFFADSHVLPTDPSEHKLEEWEVSHWRAIAAVQADDFDDSDPFAEPEVGPMGYAKGVTDALNGEEAQEDSE